jgi:hypothetical protein
MASDTSPGGSPVLVELGGEGVPLERVPLISGVLRQFDEAWLQNLVHTTPACLPTDQRDRARSGAPRADRPGIPDAPRSGGQPADDASRRHRPGGDQAVPQSGGRRLVLAQVIDYAMAVFRMDFASFEEVALRGPFSPGRKPASLYAYLSGPEQPLEAIFVDPVVKNLRCGRALIMIVGDGIRSEAEILLGDLHRGAMPRAVPTIMSGSPYSPHLPTLMMVRPLAVPKGRKGGWESRLVTAFGRHLGPKMDLGLPAPLQTATLPVAGSAARADLLSVWPRKAVSDRPRVASPPVRDDGPWR